MFQNAGVIKTCMEHNEWDMLCLSSEYFCLYTKIFKNGWGNANGHGRTPRFVGTEPVWTTFVSFQDMF